MAVSKRPFGENARGDAVTEYIITNDSGVSVALLDYGATIRSIVVPDRNGTPTDVVLGYDSIEEYEKNNCYFGAVIGRNSNRIEGARFEINGTQYVLEPNDGKNQLHGGFEGFDKKLWKATCMEDGVCFNLESPDGDQGFPGRLEVCVLYRLNNSGALEINYWAESDANTICNLTNHSYFNLAGGGDILSHRLQIFAGSYTENNSECLSTGHILPVGGTPMDFTDTKTIGRDIDADFEQLRMFGGYDHNYVLRGDFSMKCAAILKNPQNGIELTVYTDRPGMQLYSGNAIYPHKGKNSAQYNKYSGVCLETQFFPNAMRFSHFPSPVLRKGEFFRSVTIFAFAAD